MAINIGSGDPPSSQVRRLAPAINEAADAARALPVGGWLECDVVGRKQMQQLRSACKTRGIRVSIYLPDGGERVIVVRRGHPGYMPATNSRPAEQSEPFVAHACLDDSLSRSVLLFVAANVRDISGFVSLANIREALHLPSMPREAVAALAAAGLAEAFSFDNKACVRLTLFGLINAANLAKNSNNATLGGIAGIQGIEK